MEGKFVSYLRVSTARQGRSGLGLEAQREAVHTHLNGGRWKLIQEIVEIESGKHSNRPQLAKALALCRVHRATLLVAKLDRLARNVAFISKLMESGVKFLAVDMPEANELTVHIMAAMAQHEAKAISERTKAALASARKRGTELGGLRWDITQVGAKGREAALSVRRSSAASFYEDNLPIIRDKQEKGAVTLRAIAEALNVDNVPTRREGRWTATQVQRVLAYASKT